MMRCGSPEADSPRICMALCARSCGEGHLDEHSLLLAWVVPEGHTGKSAMPAFSATKDAAVEALMKPACR